MHPETKTVFVISWSETLDWCVVLGAMSTGNRRADGSPPPGKEGDTGTITDDHALLQAIASGDTNAFQQLYRRHCSLLFSLALRMLHDRDDAEDVLQDVFLQVWKTAASFTPNRGKPIVWLIMVTRSRSIDRLRSRLARERAIEESAREMPDSQSMPTQQVAANETQGIVRRAVESLPSDQRTLLELAYFKGLSQTEIAEQLGQPLGTVKTRIRAGMIRLREQLGSIVREGSFS